MNKIDLCIQIASEAHRDQVDADGAPYILHPLTVGLMGHTDEERMAGFLHDVVEDTDLTFDALLDRGVPSGVVNALRLLTHDKQTGYYDYVQSIIDSKNPIALQVKYNDLKHNFSRSKGYPRFIEKYTKAIEMVKAAIEDCSRIELYTPALDTTYAVFAGGCFWGVQHEFEKEEGVLRTLVGYTGGEEEFPQYAEVRNHETSHVEAVIVEYDKTKISYTDLCKIFFEMHDPAQTDGVGPDIGPQYRSCIFFADNTQKSEAEAVISLLRSLGHEVNTLLLPLSNFWIGEEYHQKYYEKTGGEPYCHFRTKKFPRN